MHGSAQHQKLALVGGTPVTASMRVPSWPPVSEATAQRLADVYRSGKWSFDGEVEQAFSREFAASHDAAYGVFMANGTVTLECALAAFGIGPGDEVIVPALTWLATAMAAVYLGATPVFVDIEPATLCLDPAKTEAAITPRTRAIIPVHLYGSNPDLDAIMAIAARHDLIVIEDCAQSHLAAYKNRPTGSIGDLAAFSFYPSKNLGAAGDAGAVTTNEARWRDVVDELRNRGRSAAGGYHHVRIGHNCRLDEIQAAILRVKLPRLAAWTTSRQRLAALYNEGLSGLPLQLPPLGSETSQPVFHLYTVRSDRRDALAKDLRRHGIGTGVYYPTPVHLQPAYAALGMKAGSLPVSEAASREALSLPMYAELSAADAGRVVETVRRFFK